MITKLNILAPDKFLYFLVKYGLQLMNWNQFGSLDLEEVNQSRLGKGLSAMCYPYYVLPQVV